LCWQSFLALAIFLMTPGNPQAGFHSTPAAFFRAGKRLLLALQVLRRPLQEPVPGAGFFFAGKTWVVKVTLTLSNAC